MGVQETIDHLDRDRAIHDLQHSFCVEAGAGTGKTTVLIERLIQLISVQGVPVSRLAAITFTEKAGTELRTRLREALDHRADPLALRALDELEGMQIGTLHGFASSLLRERPLEAGIAPGFQVLEPLGDQLLFDEVWVSWMDEQLSCLPDILPMATRSGISFSNMKQMARELYENREASLPPPGEDPRSLLDHCGSSLNAAIRDLEGLEASCVNPEDAALPQIRLVRVLSREWELVDDRGKMGLLMTKASVKPAGNKKNWDPPAALGQVKQILKSLSEDLQSRQILLGHFLSRQVLAWLKDFVDRMQAEKRKKGVLDFHDLLLCGRDLLSDEEVLRAIRDKFSHLLVDEYQDTDPIQTRIVFQLAEEEGALVPGKLFLVGDPKQAIYRFRRADLKGYLDARARFQSQGGLLKLVENFRSCPRVVSWVDGCFEGLMKEKGIPFEPLSSHRKEPPGSVEVLWPRAGALSEESKAEDVRIQEAEHIAGRILLGVNQGQWRVWDQDALRPAKYRDVALLFRSTTGLALYERVLQAAGIPYRSEGGKQFHMREEIVSLRNALMAIERPEDSLSLVGALRSPLFGVSDQELFEHRQAGLSFNMLANPHSPAPTIERAFGILADLHRVRHDLGIARTVEELLERTSSLALWITRTQGDQALANALKLVEMARAFQRQEGATFGSFCRRLEDVDSLSSSESESLIAEPGEDALNVMTVHKAKGLEFPVVILADLAGGARQAEKVLVDRASERIEVCLKKTPLVASQGFAALEAEEKKESDAEEVRILYVAATRAKDILVIPRFCTQKRRGFLGLLEDTGWLAEDKTSWVKGEDLPQVAGNPSVLRMKPSEADVSSYESARQAWWEKRILALRDLGALREEDPLPGSEINFKGFPERQQGLRLGSAVHKVMALCAWPHAEPLDPIVQAACEEEGVAELCPEVLRLTRDLLASPVLERARKASRVFREVSFAWEEDGALHRGRMDLVFEEEDGVVVVDYKSESWPSSEEAGKGYQVQAHQYREAVQRITQRPVRDVLFLFAGSGKIWRPDGACERGVMDVS